MDRSFEVKAPGDQTGGVAGIIIRDQVEPVGKPVIAAFIWGGKVQPTPTLPYGRWRQTAA